MLTCWCFHVDLEESSSVCRCLVWSFWWSLVVLKTMFSIKLWQAWLQLPLMFVNCTAECVGQDTLIKEIFYVINKKTYAEAVVTFSSYHQLLATLMFGRKSVWFLITTVINPGYFSKTSQTVQEWVSDKTLDRCIAHCCRKHTASIISDLPFTVLSQRQPRPRVNVIYCYALFIEKWHDVTNGCNWIEAPSSGAAYTRPEQVYFNNRQTTVCSCGTKNLCNLPFVTPLLLHASCTTAAAHDFAPKHFTVRDLK